MKRHTNTLIITSLSLLSFVFVACNNQSENENEAVKPNVVFILVDDLGVHDLSFTGSEYYETPNVDRIAREGSVFTQGYAASRVCSPSRASIMLGEFTARHGITDWIGAKSGTEWRALGRNDKLLPAAYVHNLPQADTTLAEAMRAHGYKTFFAGKWHLGSDGSHPEDHGFDINKGGWDVGSPIGGYFSPWENPKLDNTTQGENLSMRLAKETANFIEENKDSTFFAYLSFYAVHGPIQTTEIKWEKYRDKAEQMGIQDHGYEMERVLPIRTVQDNPIYGGLVEQMDDAVGLVLDKLDSLGLEDNTIVVFTSDNGGVASGDAFSTTNLPLRGGKGYQWEGGIREPYFIKVPWLENSSKTIDYPVTGTDFFPTILDLANLPLMPGQHVDGVSLKPLLEGKTVAERPLFWHYPHYGNQGGEPASIIRDKAWKLIHYWEDDRNELYNLEEDPGEKQNVADAYPEVTERLHEQLQAFLKSVDANLPARDTTFSAELAVEKHREKVEVLMPRLEQQRKQFLQKDFTPNEDWWGSKVTKD
ncbi:arylsulfatase A-like enzyme [Catalinimonas alkaloidigena]|uniref:sulfatase n=1 Tax=Catalinimonas alkaloidigena TaxID=1075417 RepID=UPI002406D3DD|nr:sulfatase [Catalinimonas alkaloidigena]MDF9799394.1 arylsulfatase A-like enzyme [Catalinimonas alkaloidigena]